MKKFYTVLFALATLPMFANAASNMAFNKTGRTTSFQASEERLIVSDRVINPNEAVKDVYINSGSFSVATWINIDQYMSLDQLDNKMVVMSYTPSHHINTNGIWSVVIDADGYLNVHGYGKYIPGNCVANAQVELNQWNHVAFVYNDDETSFALYLNGANVGEWTAKEKFNWLDENPVYNFAGWQFSGSLDEVQIFNKALSAAEIATATEDAKKVDGLKALYTLDELADGKTTQFANQVEGANYNLICQTATANTASGSYIWSNGIPFVEASSESSSLYGTVAETEPTLVEGREILLAGIDEIGADKTDVDFTAGDVEYFNLQGMKVAADNLTQGIYVARQGNKATKVFIRK